MKKRLEDIFYLFAYGVNDLSHLLVLIIFETINVLMTFVASIPFWFLAGKLFFEGREATTGNVSPVRKLCFRLLECDP